VLPRLIKRTRGGRANTLLLCGCFSHETRPT
jgi:hypothetical protein